MSDIILFGNYLDCSGLNASIGFITENGFKPDSRIDLHYMTTLANAGVGIIYEDRQNLPELRNYLQRAVSFLDGLKKTPGEVDLMQVRHFLTTPLQAYEQAITSSNHRIGYLCQRYVGEPSVSERFNRLLQPISARDVSLMAKQFRLNLTFGSTHPELPGGQIIGGFHRPKSKHLIVLVADIHNESVVQSDIMKLTQFLTKLGRSAFGFETHQLGKSILCGENCLGSLDLGELQDLYRRTGRDPSHFYDTLSEKNSGPSFSTFSGFRPIWLRNLALFVAFGSTLPIFGLASRESSVRNSLREMIEMWLGPDSPFLSSMPQNKLNIRFGESDNDYDPLVRSVVDTIHNARTLDFAKNIVPFAKKYDFFLFPVGTAHLSTIVDRLQKNPDEDISCIVVKPQRLKITD